MEHVWETAGAWAFTQVQAQGLVSKDKPEVVLYLSVHKPTCHLHSSSPFLCNHGKEILSRLRETCPVGSGLQAALLELHPAITTQDHPIRYKA